MFKLRSGNKPNFKNIGSSPAKHGTTDDFLYGRNGHNPDTMEGKHEDWHTRKMEEEKKEPSPNKQRKIKEEYWYKVDGKKVSKDAYLKYQNIPGKMEGGGKQTNDPDVYGRKCGGSPSNPKVCK